MTSHCPFTHSTAATSHSRRSPLSRRRSGPGPGSRPFSAPGSSLPIKHQRPPLPPPPPPQPRMEPVSGKRLRRRILPEEEAPAHDQPPGGQAGLERAAGPGTGSEVALGPHGSEGRPQGGNLTPHRRVDAGGEDHGACGEGPASRGSPSPRKTSAPASPQARPSSPQASPQARPASAQARPSSPQARPGSKLGSEPGEAGRRSDGSAGAVVVAGTAQGGQS
jgi:hypothetical protein